MMHNFVNTDEQNSALMSITVHVWVQMSHILSYYVMCSELTVEELQREVLLPTLLGTNQFLYFSTDTARRVR